MKLWPAQVRPGDVVRCPDGTARQVEHVGRRHNLWGIPILEFVDGWSMTAEVAIPQAAFDERTEAIRADIDRARADLAAAQSEHDRHETDRAAS